MQLVKHFIKKLGNDLTVFTNAKTLFTFGPRRNIQKYYTDQAILVRFFRSAASYPPLRTQQMTMHVFQREYIRLLILCLILLMSFFIYCKTQCTVCSVIRFAEYLLSLHALFVRKQCSFMINGDIDLLLQNTE